MNMRIPVVLISSILAFGFSADLGLVDPPAVDSVKATRLKGHTATVNSIVFSSDGGHILSGSSDETLRWWCVKTGRELLRCKGHRDVVVCATIIPGKPLAVSGSFDKTVRLWNLKDGSENKCFTGHQASVLHVAVSRDGEQIGSADINGEIILWDMSKGTVRRKLQHDKKVSCLAFSEDGKKMISCSEGFGGNIILWDLATGKNIRAFAGHLMETYGAEFLQKDKLIMSCGEDGFLKLWDIQSGREIRQFAGHRDAVYCLAISANGKLALSGGGGVQIQGGQFIGGKDPSIRLWDIESGRELCHLTGHEGNTHCVAFSPKGNMAAAGGFDKVIRLWECGKYMNVP